MNHDPASIYHHMGQRDAIAALCALIRRDGLVSGVWTVVEQLAEVNPENPHIEPVLKILNEAEKEEQKKPLWWAFVIPCGCVIVGAIIYVLDMVTR